MTYIRLEKDADGIVELIFDQAGKSVNVMGDEYAEAMPKALDELEAMGEVLTGVYVRSGKPGQFFAGGDITIEQDFVGIVASQHGEVVWRRFQVL